MTTELTMLLASVALYFVLSMLPALRTAQAIGLKREMGPRDEMPAFAGKDARSDRLLANMGEALLMFTPLVLLAAHLGVVTNLTKLGAEVFFGARVAHAICYVFGIPVVKSLAYLSGMVGIGMIAWELVQIM